MKTNKIANEEIVATLRTTGITVILHYAAARIEELESEVSQLQGQIKVLKEQEFMNPKL